MTWHAHILTLFPDMFPGPLGYSVVGNGLKNGLWSLKTLDIRAYTRDKHRAVDDTPAGGGPGLVMRPDVIAAALDASLEGVPEDRERWPVVCLSPRGRVFTQRRARKLAQGDGMTLLCGRFEGVDQRALDARGIEEICVGDAVLTGGEIPAMALVDATVRLLPGILGSAESTEDESFSAGLLEHPQYTRPRLWEGRQIPEVLLSGHHARIARWRLAQAERLTEERRPDLWAAYHSSGQEQDDTQEEQSNRTPKRSGPTRDKD